MWAKCLHRETASLTKVFLKSQLFYIVLRQSSYKNIPSCCANYKKITLCTRMCIVYSRLPNVGMVMVVHFQGQCLLWLLSKCIWMKGGFLQSRRWIAAYLINLNDSLFALTITSKELQNNVCVVKEDNLEKYPQTREPGLCPLGMHVIYRNQRNLSVNKLISSRHVWPWVASPVPMKVSWQNSILSVILKITMVG